MKPFKPSESVPYIYKLPTAEEKLALFGECLKELTNNAIALDNSLKDFADYLYLSTSLASYLKDKKKNAPDWNEALQRFLNSYTYVSPALERAFGKVGFSLAVDGENILMKNLAGLFMEASIPGVTYYTDRNTYIELAKGYRVGLEYHSLARKLKKLDASTNSMPAPLNNKNRQKKDQKLQIKCSPAQFSTILEMLMNKGYIENNGNADGTAKILLQAFSFENNPKASFESIGKTLFKGAVIPLDGYKKIAQGTIPNIKELT